MSQGYSGYEGNVYAGANDCQTQGWTADVETGTWDSTTTADNGWEDVTGGTSKVSGSFDILYNPSAHPFSALGLTNGAIVTLQLYINKPAGQMLTGLAFLSKVSIKSRTKEGITLTISFTSKGAWTLPT